MSLAYQQLCTVITKKCWLCIFTLETLQVVNKLVNKSFKLDPAGQPFVNARQFLAILSHKISIEGLPDLFFPTQTQKKKSGLATRDYHGPLSKHLRHHCYGFFSVINNPQEWNNHLWSTLVSFFQVFYPTEESLHCVSYLKLYFMDNWKIYSKPTKL